jgi:guanylate kinase
VSPEAFQGLVERDAFLEWAVYGGNRYGTSRRSIEGLLSDGRDVLLEIEVQGARQVRKRREDARFLFLLPPSMKVLCERLQARGTDTEEQIASRLERAQEELMAAEDFDYAVVNDELEGCVESVLAIIGGELSGEIAVLRRRFAPAAALAALLGKKGA